MNDWATDGRVTPIPTPENPWPSKSEKKGWAHAPEGNDSPYFYIRRGSDGFYSISKHTKAGINEVIKKLLSTGVGMQFVSDLAMHKLDGDYHYILRGRLVVPTPVKTITEWTVQ